MRASGDEPLRQASATVLDVVHAVVHEEDLALAGQFALDRPLDAPSL
jgi:hypothetical protein